MFVLFYTVNLYMCIYDLFRICDSWTDPWDVYVCVYMYVESHMFTFVLVGLE
jgi:hypothetical protein